ncbi:hypothetical protein B0T25DRAFT_315905 [Lasiosphaeria hispida]|uniref:Uncharacterized protein n=1 Tax=Lasiosphaeria hispida TaxID=260671 RepID=A0AAJ0H928_9PEZI|nr:hypothetical protein B0T25DRAFT_315905 [Lasiosphaeria hispida]
MRKSTSPWSLALAALSHRSRQPTRPSWMLACAWRLHCCRLRRSTRSRTRSPFAKSRLRGTPLAFHCMAFFARAADRWTAQATQSIYEPHSAMLESRTDGYRNTSLCGRRCVNCVGCVDSRSQPDKRHPSPVWGEPGDHEPLNPVRGASAAALGSASTAP